MPTGQQKGNNYMNEKINQFAEALKAAKTAALEANQPNNDGGTCNIDTPVIDFTGWKKKDINIVEAESGIIFNRITGQKFWKNCYLVATPLYGQGDNRSRMAEAASKKLKELGIPSHVYYQMD